MKVAELSGLALSFAGDDRRVNDAIVSVDGDFDGARDATRAEQSHQVVGSRNGSSVQRHDDVAAQQACARRRSFRLDVFNAHRLRTRTDSKRDPSRQLDRLRRDSKMRAPDAPMLNEPEAKSSILKFLATVP